MIGPMEPGSLLSQHHRINRAVNTIHRSLGAPMDLDDLADIACMSKFHFSRVFSAHMGESPASFLWRKRLEEAALKLKSGLATSITDTALDYCFSSPEAFSRAFARQFGLAPSYFSQAVRSNRRWASSAARSNAVRLGGFRERAAPAPEGVSVQIETIPTCRVAYLRRRGAYNVFASAHNEIGAGFGALFQLAEREGFLHDDGYFVGICLNSPRLTFASQCLYDICMTLRDDVPENGPVGVQTIPGGRFAILRVTCPAPAIAEYWNWLLAVWLPASGAVRELAPSFERYSVKREISEPGLIETEICLRIKSR